MKRRRFLLALAVFVPLAMFGAAKWTTRWRPVAIAKIVLYPGAGKEIIASQRYVAVGYPKTLLDLETGARRPLSSHGAVIDNEGILTQGAWKWQVKSDSKAYLRLREGNGAALVYHDPKLLENDSSCWDSPTIRVSEASNRVELWLGYRYCRWNKTTRCLERSVRIDLSSCDRGGQALSRDGERVISAESNVINTASTRARGTLRSVLLFDYMRAFGGQISPYGTYALFAAVNNARTNRANPWRVVDTKTARTLWTFPTPTLLGTRDKFGAMRDAAVISPDETRIALAYAARDLWEIRDLKTGVLLRTLPLLPDVENGAFSPDNQTLYSVTNNVLYRQRAL